MKNQTIKELRQNGVKVEVIYRRWGKTLGCLPMFEIRSKKLQKLLYPKGGMVSVRLTKDGKDFVGESFCSREDIFVKKFGLNKALGRAIQAMVKD